MMENERKRVDRAISNMIDDLYRSHLRQMQSEMHLCASRCCRDGTLETVQNCIEGCADPLLKAQDILQNELGQFQGQLQHCVMQCSDTIGPHELPPNLEDNEVAKYRYQFERCTVKCVDDNLRLIPTMMKTLKAVLAKVHQNHKMSLSKIDDTDMDQEKYLREVTHHFRGIEKPLKYGPQITQLPDLIAALHKEFESNYVNIEMVNHIMLTYKSNPKEWQKFAKFDRYKYTRNLVDGGNGKFNLMILCWGEGHGSAIHDHSDSHCFMKMLKGELKETRYEFPSINEENVMDVNGEHGEHEFAGDELRESGESSMALNEVAYINDNLGLHRVENPSHSDTAVSLHLYCPPFDSCSVFQKNSGKRMQCNVTFWSKNGVRQTNE